MIGPQVRVENKPLADQHLKPGRSVTKVRPSMFVCTYNLYGLQVARILVICLAVCSLPSLAASPTDKMAGPSQENAAAALDLLADAGREDTNAHGSDFDVGAPNQFNEDLVAIGTAVVKPCKIRPCRQVCKNKTKQSSFGLRYKVTVCDLEQSCSEQNERCAESISDQERGAMADLKQVLSPQHVTRVKPAAEGNPFCGAYILPNPCWSFMTTYSSEMSTHGICSVFCV